MKVKVSSVLVSKWTPKKASMLDSAIAEIATVIHERAVMLAPHDKGNLVASGMIKRLANSHYIIRFGGSSGGFNVPYAKRRHYENRKNPHTKFYLQNAGDGVKRSGIKQYLRNM